MLPLRKLDVETSKRFNHHTMPSVSELVHFLHQECINWEDAQLVSRNLTKTHLIQNITTNSQPITKKHYY